MNAKTRSEHSTEGKDKKNSSKKKKEHAVEIKAEIILNIEKCNRKRGENAQKKKETTFGFN